MNTKLLVLLMFISLMACESKPEPLVMGRDACHTCKMTLMDKRFGAEIISKKGKVYKFDDMNCMLAFRNAGNEPERNIEHCLVVDFAHAGKLIDATKTLYCQSPHINSPMGSHVAAFETSEDVNKYNSEWQGNSLTWNELVTQFK
jgi:copper chaperone NosL